MAIRRTSNNSINNAVKLSTGFASAAIPNSPTIGTATATSDVAATVTYTAAVLGATASTFTATSNPGSVTGTGSSPITVTGLTASTAYTFTVTAGNANGTSAASSASNSITTSASLNSYESIATATVGAGGSSSITFSSIPGTFKHLQLRYIARSEYAEGISAVGIQITTSNTNPSYEHGLAGDGTDAFAAAADAYVSNGGIFLRMAGNNLTSGIYGVGVVDILDYENTNKNKTIRALSGVDSNGGGQSYFSSRLYNTNSAITQIKLIPNFTSGATGTTTFKQYSHFALYGIKGA